MFDFDEDQERTIERVVSNLEPAADDNVQQLRRRFSESEWPFVLESIKVEIHHEARFAMFARATADAIEDLGFKQLERGRASWAHWFFDNMVEPAAIWGDERWISRICDETPLVMAVAATIAQRAVCLILDAAPTNMGPFSLN